jgi:hypothetical protein
MMTLFSIGMPFNPEIRVDLRWSIKYEFQVCLSMCLYVILIILPLKKLRWFYH